MEKAKIKFYIVQNTDDNNYLARGFPESVYRHFNENPNEYFIVEEWIANKVKRIVSLNGLVNSPFFTTLKDALYFLKDNYANNLRYQFTVLEQVILVENCNETIIYKE